MPISLVHRICQFLLDDHGRSRPICARPNGRPSEGPLGSWYLLRSKYKVSVLDFRFSCLSPKVHHLTGFPPLFLRKTEIRAIVNRRRESEYLLRRLNSRKADYLRYIEAEMNLEKLRALRSKKLADRKHRKALTPEEQQKHNKKKDSKIGDGHIIQHVHTLFVRALRKFRGDVSLHLQHAAFAKEAKSFNRLDKIYTQALQVRERKIESHCSLVMTTFLLCFADSFVSFFLF